MALADVQAAAASYALRFSADEVIRLERMASRAHQTESSLWTKAGITQGARVADVGCGPGVILRLIADIVRPESAAVGVEPDVDARAVAEGAVAGIPHARVLDGDGLNTRLESGVCDVVMVRHALFHTGQHAAGIVAHLAERLRPRGRCYLVDADLAAAHVVPHHDELVEERCRYIEFQRPRGSDVRIACWIALPTRDVSAV